MMMALAIAHHIRDQVVFLNEPIIVPSQYGFDIERKLETQYDYGETMTIV
jgi:hypothetical protein